eukprot:m.258860 g.258860  ORF g.258860 m.258860 type:complete len:112 (-) comp37203_c0_seq1:259-594(-)
MSVAQAEIDSEASIFFYRSGCPYCSQAEKVLNQMKIEYKRVNAPDGSPMRKALLKVCGKTSVPQGFVHGVHIGGCNDGAESWMGIVPLAKNGKLKAAISGKAQDALATLKA